MTLRAPNVFVLIVTILALVGALTWVVPGGSYERVRKEMDIGTREVVVPGSYKPVPAVRQTPWDILKAPLRGFEAGAEVIGFILLVGGAFGVLNRTGAIVAFLTWLTARVGGSSARYAMIPVLMFTFSLGGALFGMAEETLVFVMLTIPLAVALGFDTVTGIAIPFVGSQVGFATAFVNPFTLGIAKGIAEQPFDEGKGYRLFCWGLVTGVATLLVLVHAWRVSKDPSLSPTPACDEAWRKKVGALPTQAAGLSGSQVLVLLAFGASMVLLGVGALEWEWYIVELSGLFLGMALVCGLLGRLSGRQMADSFTEGAKDLTSAALLVAFSRGILLLAQDGRIIDTLLHGMAGGLQNLGPMLTAQAMFLVHTLINFFVPSGSGQAALTMPLMVPLADLTHMSRETAILTFQFGDGLTNLVIPTNPVVMGVIAVAGLEYGQWLSWMGKRLLLIYLLAMLLVALIPY
jgi:uncharacterized ion transporter superfamily protein YfcC